MKQSREGEMTLDDVREAIIEKRRQIGQQTIGELNEYKLGQASAFEFVLFLLWMVKDGKK